MTATAQKFRFAFLALLSVLVLVAVPAALAGKGGGGGRSGGGGGGGSTLSLVMVSDTGTAGVSYDDTITFKVSTSASWPSVELACSQNGTLVYTATRGFYPTYMWSQNYVLAGGYWDGGAADCTATLYTTNKNGSRSTLATLPVSVSA